MQYTDRPPPLQLTPYLPTTFSFKKNAEEMSMLQQQVQDANSRLDAKEPDSKKPKL